MLKPPALSIKQSVSLILATALMIVATNLAAAQTTTTQTESAETEQATEATELVAEPAITDQEEATTPLNAVSLTASPPRVGDDRSLKVQPGGTTSIDLRVINTSDVPITFTSTAQDFLIGADGVTPEPVELAGLDNRWSLASWLTVTPNQQTVQPGESAGLSVLITVPYDALPGGHYAMITHQPVFGDPDDGKTISQSSTGVNQKVGSLIYLLVEGDITEQAYIRNLMVPGFQEFGPVEFSFNLENQSDVHIHPQIGVTVTNWLGQRVGEIQPDTNNIFPYTSRSFASKWERVWGLGRYKLEVVASYGTGGQLVMDHAYFWLIPIKLIIAILCVILVLIAMLIVIRRHWLHRQQDQSQRIAELEEKLKSAQQPNKPKATNETATSSKKTKPKT